MKRAVVVAGGGGKGAFSAGVLWGLHRQGLRFDILVGVSVGALNVALPPEQVREAWQSIRGSGDVYTLSPRFILTLGRASALYSTAPLRALLERHVNVAYLRSGRREFRFVATDLERGEPVIFSQHDPPIDALMASTALPGLFPPLEVGGKVFADGGFSMNAPVGIAIDLGADDITVILHGPEASEREASGARAREIGALALQTAVHQNVVRDLAQARLVNRTLNWAAGKGISLDDSPFEGYRLRRLRVITPTKPLRGGTIAFEREAITHDLAHGIALGQGHTWAY